MISALETLLDCLLLPLGLCLLLVDLIDKHLSAWRALRVVTEEAREVTAG